jgi:hypothetical protein
MGDSQQTSIQTNIQTSIQINKEHNGKGITKIIMSPQSEYIVTYSKEDDSFLRWHIDKHIDKHKYVSVGVASKEIPDDNDRLLNLDFSKKVVVYEANENNESKSNHNLGKFYTLIYMICDYLNMN